MAIKQIDTGETEVARRARLAEAIDEVNRLTGEETVPTSPRVLPVHDVASAPADPADGLMIFVSDGDAGSPCLAVSSGGDWLVVSLGSAIAVE